MSSPCLVLKKGKEKPLLQQHHWIFSGAVSKDPSLDSPAIVDVYSSQKELLGKALYTPKRSILAHMLAFGAQSIEEALHKRITQALALRKKLFDPQATNAYRLINAEGDGIPGLIVDSYDNALVLQISHPALEELKPLILDLLVREAKPSAIFEKSTSFLRKKEGMEPQRSHLYGEASPIRIILENGLEFKVDLLEGQKTGFFLDQRSMRELVCQISSEKSVLNTFSYTGGFSVAALKGGATRVDSVDSSAHAEQLALENVTINHLDANKHTFYKEDVFSHLRHSSLDYDLIILDPPAFVKKRSDIANAFRAYKELNRLVMEKMPAQSLLLTCSCSYHVSEELFQNILFRAAKEAGRLVKIVQKHRLGFDHPISLFHPESGYLKSFLLFVE